jgi:hypothetical protein
LLRRITTILPLTMLPPNDHHDRRRTGLFLLAAACAFLAGQGLFLLFNGDTGMEIVRGGGEVLLWGCAAAAVLARVHGHALPGARLGIWTGAGLVVASWLY